MKLYYEIFVINDIRIAVKRMRTFRERKNNEIRYADRRTDLYYLHSLIKKCIFVAGLITQKR
jgi:hypothetical protein